MRPYIAIILDSLGAFIIVASALMFVMFIMFKAECEHVGPSGEVLFPIPGGHAHIYCPEE